MSVLIYGRSQGGSGSGGVGAGTNGGSMPRRVMIFFAHDGRNDDRELTGDGGMRRASREEFEDTPSL